MVRTSVDRLGQSLPVCFARPILFQAGDALERGDLVASGCYLREAARRFLECQCKYHDCLPSKKAQRSARLLAKALNKAGHCHGDTLNCLHEIIDTGNRAAHCVRVKPAIMECCISLLHSLLDSATGYAELRRNGGAV